MKRLLAMKLGLIWFGNDLRSTEPKKCCGEQHKSRPVSVFDCDEPHVKTHPSRYATQGYVDDSSCNFLLEGLDWLSPMHLKAS